MAVGRRLKRDVIGATERGTMVIDSIKRYHEPGQNQLLSKYGMVKGDWNELDNYREISLLSISGDLYGKTEIGKMQITKNRICEEQGGFRMK